jgi:hypothetical protein
VIDSRLAGKYSEIRVHPDPAAPATPGRSAAHKLKLDKHMVSFWHLPGMEPSSVEECVLDEEPGPDEECQDSQSAPHGALGTLGNDISQDEAGFDGFVIEDIPI